MLYGKFTKSLIVCDFDDVQENPFRYVHLFLLHILLSKNILKTGMHYRYIMIQAITVQHLGQVSGFKKNNPGISMGLSVKKLGFLTFSQKHYHEFF